MFTPPTVPPSEDLLSRIRWLGEARTESNVCRGVRRARGRERAQVRPHVGESQSGSGWGVAAAPFPGRRRRDLLVTDWRPGEEARNVSLVVVSRMDPAYPTEIIVIVPVPRSWYPYTHGHYSRTRSTTSSTAS